MQLNVYRKRSVIESFSIDEKTKLIQEFFGGNRIVSEFSINRVLNITIGDYLVYGGIRYYVNMLPEIVKESTNRFSYKITFEAEYYELAKVQFQNLDGESDFNYVSTAGELIDLLVFNLNRIYGSGVWTKGSCNQSDTAPKLFHFEAENCRAVLQRICSEFDCEASFAKKEIGLEDRIGIESGLIFQYKAGLRGITRTSLSDKNIVTRLYALGADMNLGDSYGSTRLRLPVIKNLLVNSGFETGDFTGWSQWGYPDVREVVQFYSPLVTSEGEPVPVGTYAYHHLSTFGSAGSTQSLEVKPSTAYTLSCYVYVESIGSLRLLTQADGTYYHAALEKMHQWERVSLTVTTGADQTSLSVWIGNIGECYFDAVQIERSDVLTPYVSGSVRYLEKNPALYGTIENTIIYEDIYPSRTGTISAVESTDPTVFYDSGMDFDLNGYLLSGITAKVNFLTGDLAGYTFEVESYSHDTKKYVLIEYDQRNGEVLPTELLRPAPGDTYVLVDITLPASYVTAAEEKLLAKAESYIDENSQPRVTYELKPDPRYFKQHNISLSIGDRISIQDDDLCVNVSTRVVELTKTLCNPYDIELKLSDRYESGIIQRLYDAGHNLKNKAQIDNLGDLVKAGLKKITPGELRNIIIAPDGYIRIGLLTADNIITGRLESADGSTYFDLDNNILVIGSATGYGNIADRPTSLGGLSPIDGAKLDGIQSGATVGATWGANLTSIPQRFTDSIPPSGSGLQVTASRLGYYASGTWKVYIDNSGNLVLGDIAGGGKGLAWNQAAATLSIRGSLNADDIIAGTLSGITVQVYDESGNGVQLDGANNNLTMWKSSNLIALLDDSIAGVTTKTGLWLAQSTGAQFLASKADGVLSAKTHYSLMDDGHITVVNNEADATAVITSKRTANDTTALFLADYRGTGDGVFLQGQDASNTHIQIYRYNNAGRILLGDAGTTDIQIGKSATSLGDGVWARDGFECYLGVAINEFSTDGTLGGNSDNAVPTEKAVKTYTDSKFTGVLSGTYSLASITSLTFTNGLLTAAS